MVMDVLRKPHRHKVYWDNAKTLSSDIVWYPAPVGAKTFPGLHTFGSETYDPVHWFCPGAGEDEATRSRAYSGAMPGPFTGQRFCGPREWFENGCPSNAPRLDRNAAGLPSCCFGRGAYSDAYSEAWDVFRGRKS